MNNHRVIYSHLESFNFFFPGFLQIKITQKVVQDEHKDDIITRELEDTDKESSDIKPYATPHEIETGKLPPEEILSLPMFKVPNLWWFFAIVYLVTNFHE